MFELHFLTVLFLLAIAASVAMVRRYREGLPVLARPSTARQLKFWRKLCRVQFEIELDFASVRIPKQRRGFARLIVVAKGITLDRICSVMGKLGFAPVGANLDGIVSDRTAENGSYAIWVRDRQEADEEMKYLSAKDLKERGISGVTIEEHFLHEIAYFFVEFGNHLDVEDATLCSGSRSPDGGVPYVRCGGARVGVRGYDHYCCTGRLRARVAVS